MNANNITDGLGNCAVIGQKQRHYDVTFSLLGTHLDETLDVSTSKRNFYLK